MAFIIHPLIVSIPQLHPTRSMLRPAVWSALLIAFPAIYTNAAAQLHEGPGLASDSVRISLLTVLPGHNVYSLWGHSAIRVTVPSQGIDVSYNYGTFDFEADWFVPRFMYGSLLYRLSRHDYELAAHSYREIEERPMIEQVLNLSPAQEDSLIRFLEINYLPENRLYTYDFVYDNCSTRIRDALERSLGEAVRFADRPDPQSTFRELLDPYHREWPFLDAGIDWLLGAPVDRMARPHETMFLPDHLMTAFEHATIRIDGERAPLVVSTDTLFWVEGYERIDRFQWEIVVGWLLFGLGAVLSVRAARRGRRVLRIYDPALFLIVGLVGVLITFLWFISLHDVTSYNWHLLWSWPTHLVAGVALMRGRVPPWLAGYLLIAAVMALVALVGAPLWPQDFHPVLFPIMLLVALRGGWLWFHRPASAREGDASADPPARPPR